MPSEKNGNHGTSTLVAGIGLGLVTLAVMLLIGYSVAERRNKLAQTAATQQAVSEQRRAVLLEAAQYACREIEKLKAADRSEARRAYRERAVTFRLLNLKPSPELEQLALESRDRRLSRNKFVPCPIKASDLGLTR